MDPQPINPTQPTPTPTPVSAPDPAPTPAPITSSQPVQDVPTVHGDPSEKKEGLSNTILVLTVMLAFYGLRGLTIMSVDSARCTALDQASANLCGTFNTAIITKNICFGSIMLLCAANIYFLSTKKKLARTLGATFMGLTAIAAFVSFLSVSNLINAVGEAIGARDSVAYMFSQYTVEYGIFAGLVALYAIVGIIYLLTSKTAKQVFVN